MTAGLLVLSFLARTDVDALRLIIDGAAGLSVLIAFYAGMDAWRRRVR